MNLLFLRLELAFFLTTSFNKSRSRPVTLHIMKTTSLLFTFSIPWIAICVPFPAQVDPENEGSDMLSLNDAVFVQTFRDQGPLASTLAFNDRPPIPPGLPTCPKNNAKGKPTFLACCSMAWRFSECHWWNDDGFCTDGILACCAPVEGNPDSPSSGDECQSANRQPQNSPSFCTPKPS